MLTDTQWAMLEPLVEQCRPRGKTPPQDLRRTLDAILWRHENGAKWRRVPTELGPWWRAAQTFIRGRVWVSGAPSQLVQVRGVQLGMTFLDGTSVRAHQKAAGARRKGALKLKALGRVSWRLWHQGLRDRRQPGRAIAFGWHRVRRMNCLTPFRCSTACRVCLLGVADRGYSSHSFREHIWSIGAKPAIPSQVQ
jgi:transposase